MKLCILPLDYANGVGGNKLGMSGLTISLLLDNTELRLSHS